MKKIIVKLIIFIIISISIIYLYGRYIGTSGLKTNEYKIEDNIANSYDGLKIVHFSDIHYGRITFQEELENIVDEINLINPDIVVFTGDLIDKDYTIKEEDYNIITNFLSSINAKYGKYAVRGNHDYLVCNNYAELLTKGGFKYLANDYDIIYNNNNDKIFIGGLDTSFYNMEDIEKLSSNSLNDVSYKIVLTHEGDIADEIIKYDSSINLILAGHSHNGQINIPYLKKLFVPTGSKKYYNTFYQIDNTKLYISSGIGTSLVNIRLFNHPSINFYRINKNTQE